MNSQELEQVLPCSGYPIRKSTGQSVFAAHRSPREGGELAGRVGMAAEEGRPVEPAEPQRGVLEPGRIAAASAGLSLDTLGAKYIDGSAARATDVLGVMGKDYRTQYSKLREARADLRNFVSRFDP
jgi:hypothetical protein